LFVNTTKFLGWGSLNDRAPGDENKSFIRCDPLWPIIPSRTERRPRADRQASGAGDADHASDGRNWHCLDVPGSRMFVTDSAGSVYSADLDGKNKRNFLYAQGNLTGIAYAEI